MSVNAPKAIFGFFSKETMATPRTGDTSIKPEWELRFAGDFALMLQDYGSALTNYKRMWDKIQKATAYEEMGSCKEAIAISSMVVEINVKDFMKNMEAAVQYYKKCDNSMLLIKNAIYAFDILGTVKKYSHASTHLSNICNCVLKEAEAPGLLTEQAAYALINSSTASIRKFSRYLMFAGNYYLNQALFNNAIHCLVISYFLYKKSNWPEVLASISNSIAHAFSNVNNYRQEFAFFRRLLDVITFWNIEINQEYHLNSLVNAAEKLKSTAELSLEEVNKILQMNNLVKISVVGILAAQDKIYSNVESILFNKCYDMPKKPELKLSSPKGVYNIPQLWMTLGKMIDGDLSNPYEDSKDPKHKLKEERLRDLWFYDEKYTQTRTILYTKKKRFVYALEHVYLSFQCKNPLKTPLHLSQLSIKCHYNDKEGSYEVQNNSLTLNPNEMKEVLLWVLPKEEGELVIDGIQWVVANSIPGCFNMSEMLGKSEIVLVVRSRAGELDVLTNKNPRLEYLDGEMDSYTLILKNTGELPISQIDLQTDYPLIFGWRSIKLDWILNPNEQKELKINFRAGIIEDNKRLSPRILIRYIANPETSWYRYKRIEHNFVIRNLLVLKTDYNRSYTTLNEYFLNVQIERLCIPCTSFEVNEICIIENNWKIFEKKRFSDFSKIFNSFFTLIHSEDPVPLGNKHIVFTRTNEPIDLLDISEDDIAKSAIDISQIEENANYIKEYKRVKIDSQLNLLLSWKLELGIQKSMGINILPITLSEPARAASFPLKVIHKCQSLCLHDFEASPMCKIPLVLLIQNISLKNTNFRFEALKVHREKKEKSANFVWQGTEAINCLNIVPNGQCEIQIDACMIAPGVYDLNRFSFMFFRDPVTGEDLDPSGQMLKNVAMDIFELESEQIFVTILQSSR